ncbi:transposase [Plantactinospora solaniradicis]|uniref:Transposase n=1 Tax=Plantactinospora solaniradicis TaxID=1723736 RepID=A0ABW1KGH6_9ACTN
MAQCNSATERILVVGERHLAAVLNEYSRHYNQHRSHRSLTQRPPNPVKPALNRITGMIQRHPVLGGLINEYSQAA